MENIIIRLVKIEDAEDINKLRTTKGAYEYICAYPDETIETNRKFLSSLTDKDHLFVAEITQNSTKKVIAMAGIHKCCFPRKEHTASMGLIVHPEYHNKGIGTKLVKHLLEFAPKLNIKRIELEVVADNIVAINLYKKFGFEIEGAKKQAFARDNEYLDTLMMSKII